MRVIGYFVCCGLAVVAAQIGAIVLTFVLAFANITQSVAYFLGGDTAEFALGFVGNLIFAVIFGLLVAAALHWYRPTLDEGAQTIAAVAAGILGFVFPLFTGGALLIFSTSAPGVLIPLANPAVALASVFAAYAIVGGSVALALGLAIDASRPKSTSAE